MLDYAQKTAIQNAIHDSLGYSPSLDKIEATPVFQRFPTAKKDRLDGYFRVYQFGKFTTCHFGDWSRGISFDWKDGSQDGNRLSERERENIRRTFQEEQKQEEERKLRAIENHRKFFSSLPHADSIGVLHPYLMKKCLRKSYVAKYNRLDDTLLFPFVDSRGAFKGYESISITGRKKIAKDSMKKGSFLILNPNRDNSSILFACEGYATGITISEAMKKKVIVCIDAGNLTEGIRSATTYLKVSPERVFIVADNDTNRKGETEAQKACDSLGCHYLLTPGEGMDANDYACSYGLTALTRFLQGAIKNERFRD